MPTNNATHDTSARWNGWARIGGARGKWRCLVRFAASDREALDELRRLTAGWQFVDLCVRPVDRGGPDNDRRRPAA